ncbi:MAG: hypothetical protein ACREI8_08985 [Myxococcota bacterium]
MITVPQLASALWGLALLASFVGFGRWIAAGCGVRQRAHVGLTLSWGFAGALSAGGWLCLFGFAQGPVLAALVGLGGTGLLLRPRRARTSAGARETGFALRAGLAALCISLLGLSFATALLHPHYHYPDDQAAYLFHARKILETGSLYEPFSFRRLASYGGQSFLHALLLLVAPIEQLNLLDKGICRVAVAIGMLAHVLARPRRSLFAAAVVVYAVAVYPDIALNTSSIFSGVLAFVGLWLTLDFCRSEGVGPIAKGILTGLAVAGAVPLRQNYGLACALVVLLEHARRHWTVRDRGQARELAAAAGSAALCLGGWALLQIQSGGTPLFPLLRGFANPEWNVLSADSLDAFWRALGHFLDSHLVSVELALCGLALWPRRSGETAELFPLAAAALVAFGANAWLLAHAQAWDIERYTVAFLLPVALFAWARAATALVEVRSTSALRDWHLWLCGLCLLMLVSLLPPTHLTARVRFLQDELRLVGRWPLHEATSAFRYAQLQSAAPAGAKLLAMLDHPYLLDLRRNDVVSLDLPGGASPPPGLHGIEEPEEVVRYFVGLGRPWLAAIRPAHSRHLYALGTWTSHASGVPQRGHDPSDAKAWRVMGRTIVHFFEQFDAIARSCRLAYDDGTLVMIDLSRCRFEATVR